MVAALPGLESTSRTAWYTFRRDPVASIARWLHSRRPRFATDNKDSQVCNPIRVVCLSDTHNTQPQVPNGDILLHAGDLTNDGTFTEIQDQLTWLASLPHPHKIVIAGNHDRLLDAEYVAEHPQRIVERPGSSRSDLDWRDIIYLQDSPVTLSFPISSRSCEAKATSSLPSSSVIPRLVSGHQTAAEARTIKIYGCPRTPLCGTFAFQYLPIRDVWLGSVPDDTDIVLTHGPPKGYLDNPGRGSEHKGCPQLLRELRRVRPRLVVFGHIHSAFGKEDVAWTWGEEKISSRLADVTEAPERLEEQGLMRWMLVGVMILGLLATWMEALISRATRGSAKRFARRKGVTTMVNAAVGTEGSNSDHGLVAIEL